MTLSNAVTQRKLDVSLNNLLPEIASVTCIVSKVHVLKTVSGT